MQVTIGIKHVSRELSLETSDSQDKVLAAARCWPGCGRDFHVPRNLWRLNQ